MGVSKLSEWDGERYSVSDVLRLAVAHYYEVLSGPADPAAKSSPAAEPAPAE